MHKHNLELLSAFRLIGNHEDIKLIGNIPNINYTQYLSVCKYCGAAFVESNFKWEYTDLYLENDDKLKFKLFGKKKPDIFIPLCLGGFGDVLMVLRMLPVFKKYYGNIGLILMKPHNMLINFILTCSDVCSILLVDEEFNQSGWDIFIKFINSNKEFIPVIDFKGRFILTDIVNEYPIFSVDNNGYNNFDIIIHRRNIDHNIGKNFTEIQFANLVNILSKYHSIAVVGDINEDTNCYVNDLRNMDFLDQIRVISKSKMVIDTDSIFDKIAEGFGIGNINIIKRHDKYWGYHWLYNNSYTIFAENVDCVNIDDILFGVDVILNRKGLLK